MTFPVRCIPSNGVDLPLVKNSSGLTCQLTSVSTTQISAISPFSSGGSLVLGSCATEEDRNQMFPKLLFKAVPMSVISAIIFSAVMALVL